MPTRFCRPLPFSDRISTLHSTFANDRLGGDFEAAALGGSQFLQFDIQRSANALGASYACKLEVLGAGLHSHVLAATVSRTLPDVSVFSGLRTDSHYADALRAAESIASLRVPGLLEQHRLDPASIANQLAVGKLAFGLDSAQWRTPSFLAAYNGASAISHAMLGTGVIGSELQNAIRLWTDESIGSAFVLKAYRGILDAAGLVLPRWPRFRPLTKKELFEQQRRKLALYKQPRQVARAKSLVHQYESYLQDAIDQVMTIEYGDNWPEERIALCGSDCKSLLGKWRKRGGAVLDHADYIHYVAILTQAEHFDTIFSLAFSDRDAAAALLAAAGRLRAASHHPGGEFTPEDLRDLRVTWNVIGKALRTLETGTKLVPEW